MKTTLYFTLFSFSFFSCEEIEKSLDWSNQKPIGFIRKYGKLGYDYGWNGDNSIYDNGSIIVGSTQPNINGDKNLWVIKTNELGQSEWDYSFGGTRDEEGYDVISTSDGGYVLVGYTWSFGNSQQIYVVKLDLFGSLIWEKTYGGSMWDVGNSIIELKTGNFLITGYSNSPGISSGNTDIVLLKIDENGNQIWLNAYGNKEFPNHEWGNDLIELDDGGFMVVGSRDRYNLQNENSLIIRTDSNGKIIWEKEIITDGIEDERAYSINRAKDGQFIICGLINSLTKPEIYQPNIMKIDGYGNIEWKRTYNAHSMNYHQARANVTNNGDILISGSSMSKSSMGFKSDAFIYKIDNTGNIIWNKSYGTLDEDDWGWSVFEKRNGNIVLIGSTKSFNSSLFDAMMITINSDGLGS